MNRWYGKLLGLIAGALLFRANPLFGAVVGLLIVWAGALPELDLPLRRRDDPWAELGLIPDATDEEVEQAYRRLISQYHPDRFAVAAPELRAEAERRARAINAAYDRIRSLRGR